MKDNSLSKLGGTCSILLAVSYVLAGVSYLLQPAELQAGADPVQFWPTLAQNPAMNTLHHWGLALSGVFAIAVVTGVSEVVRTTNEGAVRFASGLAYLGYTVLAMSHFRSLAVYPTLAEWYVAGDASVQAGIGAAGYLINLDPQGWLGFGGPGLWALVINLLALEKGIWPKALAYVGIGTGILAWLVVAGNVFEIPLLIAIAAGLALIMLPIWFIWIGLRLRRAAS